MIRPISYHIFAILILIINNSPLFYTYINSSQFCL